MLRHSPSLGVLAGVNVLWHSPSLGVLAGVSVLWHSPSLGVLAGVSVFVTQLKAKAITVSKRREISVQMYTLFTVLRFRVDSLTGSLYVQGPLDRETTSQYFLSAEAIDGGGLRAPTEIQIIVTDVNDNPPLFRRSDYDGVVREKDAAFLRPIIVEVS